VTVVLAMQLPTPLQSGASATIPPLHAGFPQLAA
jgi:hypothetical protein